MSTPRTGPSNEAGFPYGCRRSTLRASLQPPPDTRRYGAAVVRAQRAGILRSTRAFFRLPGMGPLAVSVVALLGLLFVSAVILGARYQDPGTGESLGPFRSIYLAGSLVALNPVEPVPEDWACRLVYLLVPLAGLVLLGQLIVRLVVSVVNRDRWEMAMASTYSDHVLVCGLGRVGLRVVRWLLDLGEDVVVIDSPDDADQFQDQVRSWGVPIVRADA